MSTMTTDRAVSGWAKGLGAFAGAVMILVGFFHAFSGLAAIFENDFFVIRANYAFDVDISAWGWIHLILGVIVAFAGISIFTGATWARVVGVVLALLSAFANFLFIPYYPVWAVLIIALDIAIIWALVNYTGEESEYRR
jgi:hypothetical protein